MNCLYINAWQEENSFEVDIETLITLYVYKIASSRNLKLIIRPYAHRPEEPLVFVDVTDLNCEILINVPEVASFCIWPVISLGKEVVSGLCSVSRHIIRSSDQEKVRDLLGFREACLMACAESSVWTKFCEIDMPKTLKKFMTFTFEVETIILPKDFVRFEHHLSKPVRIHNIYKIARRNQNNKSLQSSTPRDQLNVKHEFSEGPFVTLADVLLYPSFKIFFEILPFDIVCSKLPLTCKWMQNIEECNFPKFNFFVPSKISRLVDILNPQVEDVSLYKADPKRELSEKHTKQYKIDDALKIVEIIQEEIINAFFPYGFDTIFNWEDIPFEVNPNGGALPEKRANRKCEQLETLAKAVVKMANQNSYRIIDFCSGSGHLGILLACLLPKCEIVLIENKERSLAGAKARISKLNLNNVIIIQSNLDYFVGNFDIGVSLHACGVATDLVIENCISNKANFVSCPCCYGSIKVCHQLSYPRSRKYKNLFKNCENSYFDLAHAADQTHEASNVKTKQGYLCMDIIDSDRKTYAEECGYEVFLGKLQPITCTNKNNLLVGVFKNIL